ncbi:dapper homolog 3 isoform X2 [Archocentrus centrarchus]|uniref:dapper homolog 3 isoform X2 n=1 Tax=Archocentrus centrarchus TaxID=63155 RepID=UPI0011EA0437|nr:dapper homolog 3 isoform X2 [Archocentrus centrarchus]
MHRAFSFPVTVERSRTKERLEVCVAGLCELELRRQRQECLVLGAMALGDPLAQESSRGELRCFSSWGQENLTLRRQLSALQSSPWGLMQMLEQQVGELRIGTDDGCCDGAQGETGSSRPSAGDPLMLNGEFDAQCLHTTLPRSFSAPNPPLEGIAEEGTAMDSWQWDPSGDHVAWQQQIAEDQVTEEDYQQALRVEGYILSLIQRNTLIPRPCQPRTTLGPDPSYCSASGHSSLHRRTPSLTTEHCLSDHYLQPHSDPSANPKSQGWGCDLEWEAHHEEAPSLEEDCYLALPYPQPNPNSLAGRLPSPLPSLDHNCGIGAPDLCCEPPSPQHYLHPQPPIHHMHSLVSAQYVPRQACHAPVCSPRHYNPEQPKSNRVFTSPDHPKSRASKKSHSERQRSKKSSSKTNRSQSENSLLGQRVLPERRYSTTERPQGIGDATQNQSQLAGYEVGNNSHNESRRWRSNLELSQDEGEIQAGQVHRRPPRKVRHGPSYSHSQSQNYHSQQHTKLWQQDLQENAPLCQGEEGYGGVAPAESESSMSEVYSPASSSLSSDSDESGGLVWPQQLPPRLASTSSSSPSPQATGNAPPQTKAFVKIKASHALKKKILRFRSGSLKVMTTV